RNAFGLTGSGIKVGVLSDSFNNLGGYAADTSRGALPPGVVVLGDELDGKGSDEGRAMLELVHQIAPGAQLYFDTGEVSDQGFADNVSALRSAGCNIIIDDMQSYTEPFFQEGPISQAIDSFVANGGLYLSAAGNQANASYMTTWAQAATQSASVEIYPGQSIFFDLQWSQPFNSPQSQLNLVLSDASGSVSSASQGYVDYGGTAESLIVLTDPHSYAIGLSFNISVTCSGPTPSLFKYIIAGDGQPVSLSSANASTGTVFGHAADPNAVAVAAADSATDALESYSSSGAGAEWLFDANGNPLGTPVALSKVNLTGVDGITTTLPGDLSDFFGTSAAAPTVGAVAALLE